MSLISVLPAHDAPRLVPLLRQVHDLHVAHQPANYTPTPPDKDLAGFLREWLAQPDVTALIAGDRDDPQGYLIWQVQDRPASLLKPAIRFAMLEHICVDVHHRGNGIATALVATMRSQCRAQGLGTIRTSYASFNTASARLMQRAGLEPVTVLAEGPVDQQDQDHA